jgi:hypothetical protein
MIMIRKKIMCLALSLAFGVMSSQAQAIDNSTSRLYNFSHYRFRLCSAKYSETFNSCLNIIKSLLLSNQQWTEYATVGTIEHTKKIIEGEDSLMTNILGIGRQFTIATDGRYTRGGTQILEQWTSDKHDVAKIGEGIGYILKGMDCPYYYPFIGASQYLVSLSRAFFTPIRVQHYTPSTVYDELTEIPKQIGAIIDMTLGMNIAMHDLFYKIRGTMGVGEQTTHMLLNNNVMGEPICRVLTYGLHGVRHGLAVATPIWTAAYQFGSLPLAIYGAIAYSVTMMGSWIYSMPTPSFDEADITTMSPLLIHPNMTFPLPRQIKLEVEKVEKGDLSEKILKYHGYRYVELSKKLVAQIEHGWEGLNIDIKYLNFPRYFVLPENDDRNPTKGFSTTCPL